VALQGLADSRTRGLCIFVASTRLGAAGRLEAGATKWAQPGGGWDACAGSAATPGSALVWHRAGYIPACAPPTRPRCHHSSWLVYPV